MKKVLILPTINKNTIINLEKDTSFIDSISSIDTDSFKELMASLLNQDGYEGASVDNISLDLQDSQLVVYGYVVSSTGPYCKFVCYFDYYDTAKKELHVSFAVVMKGSAILAVHIQDETLYFDRVVSTSIERLHRRI